MTCKGEPRRPVLAVLAALMGAGLLLAWGLHKLGHPSMVCLVFAGGVVWGVLVARLGPRSPR